jgi:hypothetical protein
VSRPRVQQQMQQPGRTTLHTAAFVSARGLLIRLQSSG